MVDERDLGTRPQFAALMPLADKIDAEKAELRKKLEPIIQLGVARAQMGEHLRAAELFDEVAQAYRAGCFLSDADTWTRRADDARTAARLGQRRTKKGKGSR